VSDGHLPLADRISSRKPSSEVVPVVCESLLQSRNVALDLLCLRFLEAREECIHTISCEMKKRSLAKSSKLTYSVVALQAGRLTVCMNFCTRITHDMFSTLQTDTYDCITRFQWLTSDLLLRRKLRQPLNAKLEGIFSACYFVALRILLERAFVS
jgi:hypothetical protein